MKTIHYLLNVLTCNVTTSSKVVFNYRRSTRCVGESLEYWTTEGNILGSVCNDYNMRMHAHICILLSNNSGQVLLQTLCNVNVTD